MSKSLNNFITITDILNRCSTENLRFLIVKNLWSSPVDYSESTLMEVKSLSEKIEDFLRRLKGLKDIKIDRKQQGRNQKIIEKAISDFYSELDDDFNTPKALAVIFDFMKTINQFIDEELLSKKEAEQIYKFFEDINKIFGIIDYKRVNQIIPIKIKKLAKDREKFRKNQEWEKADETRKEIEKQGYVIEDKKDGVVIKFV
jgi:cysteinyl-tRNA synthetase